MIEIVKNSDLTILRDSVSKQTLNSIFSEHGESPNAEKILVAFDPSMECLMWWARANPVCQGNYVCVNLREFPSNYCDREIYVNSSLFKFVDSLAERFFDREILLLPMHYFHSGNDDRAFLNQVAFASAKSNIRAQNQNLTLEETMRVYRNASFNVGMRFHSVVFQTALSGRNYVLDYTQPQSGKISGFLRDIDSEGFYRKRYFNLQVQSATCDMIHANSPAFAINWDLVATRNSVYSNELSRLFR